jgi:hypothetical protein
MNPNVKQKKGSFKIPKKFETLVQNVAVKQDKTVKKEK